MADFSKAKVGDKVWHRDRGWGRIVAVSSNSIKFKSDFVPWENSYWKDGRCSSEDVLPTIFHGPITITEPDPPVRMKKVKIKVRPYFDTLHKVYGVACNLLNVESNPIVKGSQDDYFPWSGPIQEIEIEVEEE